MVRLLLSLMHPFIWKANALHVLLWDASIVIAETQQDISVCLWRLLGTDFPPESQAICGFLCCYDERVTKNTEKEGLFCLAVSGEGVPVHHGREAWVSR